jgi:hypothetical protein
MLSGHSSPEMMAQNPVDLEIWENGRMGEWEMGTPYPISHIPYPI